MKGTARYRCSSFIIHHSSLPFSNGLLHVHGRGAHAGSGRAVPIEDDERNPEEAREDHHTVEGQRQRGAAVDAQQQREERVEGRTGSWWRMMRRISSKPAWTKARDSRGVIPVNSS